MAYIDRYRPRTRLHADTPLLQQLSEWWRIRRDTVRMSELSDEARRDMGLPSDPDREFLRRLGQRWTPRDPSGW